MLFENLVGLWRSTSSCLAAQGYPLEPPSVKSVEAAAGDGRAAVAIGAGPDP